MRSFELSGAISAPWLERCRQLDQRDAERHEAQQRRQWELWADHPAMPV
ncbi:MAG: hypothetical protein KFB97_10845 [Cyanobium sp. M30B3]|nr:MAG: hypothetical protein KFB97_10845 [Cyanobium sp. M30B3]